MIKDETRDEELEATEMPHERRDAYRRIGERLREFMAEGMSRWEAFPLAVEETLYLKALPRKPKR